MAIERLSTQTTDLQAIQMVAARNCHCEAAMRLLFDRHSSRLMSHLRYRFNLPESIAEELTAQTFLNAFEQAVNFRSECMVTSWLIKIARNLTLDHLRRENRMESLEDEEPAENESAFCDRVPAQDGPLNKLAEKQLANCVREQFNRFRQRYPEAATALWERHVNETSSHELATVLGREYGATRQFLSDWGKKLRQFVAPCYAMLGED